MIFGQTSMTEISKREPISMGGGKPGNTVQWKRQFGTVTKCKRWEGQEDPIECYESPI